MAVANMSPPSPGLNKLFDADAALFAGRPFHFAYEALPLKVLTLLDMPSMVAAIPVGILVSPLLGAIHVGSFVGSYVAALIELLVASCQWLAVGYAIDTRLESRAWGATALRGLKQYFAVVVIFVLLLTAIAVPFLNNRSRERGFRHPAISFHCANGYVSQTLQTPPGGGFQPTRGAGTQVCANAVHQEVTQAAGARIAL